MRFTRAFVPATLPFAAAIAVLAAQEARPANVPINTWVREDLFAGFLENDVERFNRGEKKVLEYLVETPGRAEANGWLAGAKLYRAIRAFREGRTGDADALVGEATRLMDSAVAAAPDNVGVHATLGGAIVLSANRLPDEHYRPLMERARTHFAKLYSVQSKALPHLPPHIRGELLAGVAETEFRVGDKTKATAALNEILTQLPDTTYARRAAEWLAAPEQVTKETKIVCQGCHEPGRLAAWQARQKP